MSYIYDMTDTWNAAGTVFSAIKMNVTNSASAAGSKLIDLQLAGNSLFNVDKNGGVGIGTTTPSARLDLGAYTGGALGTSMLKMQDGWHEIITSAAVAGTKYYYGASVYGRAYSNATGFNIDTDVAAVPLVFGTNNAERMRITSAGNVGIGTSSPAAKLEVNGTQRIAKAGAGFEPAMLSFSTLVETGAIYRIGMGTAGSFIIGRSDTSTTDITLNQQGNLGIGTTSPGYRLDAYRAGAASIVAARSDTQAVLRAEVGSVVADVNVTTSIGEVRTATNHPLLFSTNATERMRIDTNGNIGIGTSTISPYSAANRALIVDGGANVASIQLNNSTTGSGLNSGGLLLLQTGNDSYVWNPKNSFLSIGTNNTERMRIDSSGNLGLGVTPSAWGFGGNLELAATNNIAFQGSGNLLFNSFYSVSSGAYLYKANGLASRYQSTAGTHQWYTAPSGTAGNAISFTQAMTLDASGRLGIGTNAAALVSKLTLEGTLGTTGSQIQIVGTGVRSGYIGPSSNGFEFGTDSGGLVFRTGVTGNASVTTGTERMRIDSSGNLLVGTTSNAFPNANSMSYSPTTYSGQMNMCHADGSASGNGYIVFAYNSGSIGSIIQNGTTGVLYSTSSDYRLKDIDGPIQNSGAYIDALKPVQGSWKADGSRFIGLLAHEVQEVSETQIATGEKDGEEMQAMDYSAPEIIANLIAEIQSLRARVAQLEGN